jgi:hypothetical protein
MSIDGSECPLGVDAVEKGFGGKERDFLELLMRFVRGDVRDLIASQENDHGLSYRHHRASQRRSSPKTTICEIFGVVRFSTFSTASVNLGSQGCHEPGPVYRQERTSSPLRRWSALDQLRTKAHIRVGCISRLERRPWKQAKPERLTPMLSQIEC